MWHPFSFITLSCIYPNIQGLCFSFWSISVSICTMGIYMACSMESFVNHGSARSLNMKPGEVWENRPFKLSKCILIVIFTFPCGWKILQCWNPKQLGCFISTIKINKYIYIYIKIIILRTGHHWISRHVRILALITKQSKKHINKQVYTKKDLLKKSIKQACYAGCSQTLPHATPPIGKIHPFSKTTKTN